MKIGIIGAGGWGTTVGILLARNGHDVCLWARDPERARQIEERRENRRHLAGVRLPDRMHVTSEIFAALGFACDFVCGAVPTQYARAVLEAWGDDLPDVPWLSLSKGIEIATGKLPSEIYRDVAGRARPVAVLTGPCIAREIARDLPTAVVVAGDETALFQEALSSSALRVYTSHDRLGAELCAALKNVLAIAAGVVDGMELGDNIKGALLTRGIVEMTRLGVALGAEAPTFTGLAGFGDLFTTCVSPHSRNRTLGERLGRGESLDAILATMEAVAEGVPTTRAVAALAREHGVEMPIATALHAILFEGVAVATALGSLMTRRRRPEHEPRRQIPSTAEAAE